MEQHYFTCYFCNRTIHDETELGHTSVCGSVLVPCPNKCGSYVSRLDLHRHKSDCLNRVVKSPIRLNSVGAVGGNSGEPQRNSRSLDRHKTIMKMEEISKFQENIKVLSLKLANLEQMTSKHQIEPIKRTQVEQRLDLEKIKYQHQAMVAWRKNFELKLDNLTQTVDLYERSKKEGEHNWMNFQQKLMVLEHIRMDFNIFKDAVKKGQLVNQQADLELAKRLDEFKDVCAQENATVGALWSDQKQIMDELKRDMKILKVAVEEQKMKHATVVFDVKTLNQICMETLEKVDIFHKEFKGIKRELGELRTDLQNLESLVAKEASLTGIGRFLWKVSGFNEKMIASKECDSPIKSPVFFTHQFGYKIKVLLYLNGLKKWKDRYALLSIHVLNGEHDMLLKWPCHIEGTIILRDLENLEAPKHFSKFITAKRNAADESGEEPQESSSSYIFIPHSILTKEKYLRNDTIFFDIVIEQNNKLLINN